MTLVGIPVEGPARWTSTTTSGSSVITARPRASDLSERPGPLNIESDSEGGVLTIAKELAGFLLDFDKLNTEKLAEFVK